MHESLTIALLQAREAAMAFFRPILKANHLTEQHGGSFECSRIIAQLIFMAGPPNLYFTSKPNGDFDANGA